MLINAILFTLIILYFLFAIYDQFLMEKRYGKTALKIRLLRKQKIEGVVMLGLIWLAVYQAVPQGLEQMTIYLLVMVSILLIYHFFVRYPLFYSNKTAFF